MHLSLYLTWETGGSHLWVLRKVHDGANYVPTTTPPTDGRTITQLRVERLRMDLQLEEMVSLPPASNPLQRELCLNIWSWECQVSGVQSEQLMYVWTCHCTTVLNRRAVVSDWLEVDWWIVRSVQSSITSMRWKEWEGWACALIKKS